MYVCAYKWILASDIKHKGSGLFFPSCEMSRGKFHWFDFVCPDFSCGCYYSAPVLPLPLVSCSKVGLFNIEAGKVKAVSEATAFHLYKQ